MVNFGKQKIITRGLLDDERQEYYLHLQHICKQRIDKKISQQDTVYKLRQITQKYIKN